MSFQPVMLFVFAWSDNIRNFWTGIIMASWIITNWWWIALLVIAMVFALIYFLYQGKKKQAKPEIDVSEIDKMIQVLGGIDNIESISMEGARLKVLLKNLKKCEYATLKEHGAMGIFVSGKQIKFLLPKSASQLVSLIQAKKKERTE